MPRGRNLGCVNAIEREMEKALGVRHPPVGFPKSSVKPKPVNQVVSTTRYLKGNKLRITIDSGAIGHVIPAGVLDQFEVLPSEMSKSRSWFTVANGQRLYPDGEKTAVGGLGELTFQVCPGLTNMLASVRRITEAGNRVVLETDGGYIQHIASGRKVPLVLEQGVHYLKLDLGTTRKSGFARPE